MMVEGSSTIVDMAVLEAGAEEWDGMTFKLRAFGGNSPFAILYKHAINSVLSTLRVLELKPRGLLDLFGA